MLPLSD